MNNPELFQSVNKLNRRDVAEILNELKLQWRHDGGDSLIDIGSGSGNILMDYIYPLMPQNFSELAALDISEKMLDFARHNYGAKDTRLRFIRLDIATERLPQELYGRFDHVTSFYSLHWVRQQRRALENINKLLRCGDCLLLFFVKHLMHDVYEVIKYSSKWSAFMADVAQFMPPLYYSKDPLKEYLQLLNAANFRDCNVKLYDKVYVYDNLQLFKDGIKPVCPFLERMSQQQQEEFLTDFTNIALTLTKTEFDEFTNEVKLDCTYQILVAYAKK